MAAVLGYELQDFLRGLAASHDAEAQGGNLRVRKPHGDEIPEVFPGMGPIHTQDEDSLGALFVQLAGHLRTPGGVDDDVQVRKLEQITDIFSDEKMVAPGVDMRDINNRVNDILSQGLIRLGLIKDAGGLRKYYTHGLSHSILWTPW